MGMSEEVIASARDHGGLRTDGGEKRGCRRAPAAVMCDLQQIGVTDAGDELRLCFAFDVACHQCGKPAGADMNDDRAVVLRSPAETVRRHANGDRHRSDPAPLTVADEMDRDISIERRFEKVARARAAELPRRDPDFRDTEAPHDRRQTTAMIGMDVRQDDGVDRLDAAIDEHRQECRFTEARVVRASAAIDE